MSAVYGVGGESDATDIALFFLLRPSPQSGAGYAGAMQALLRLGTCNYIHEHRNVILLGATGSGKTYLACALGMAAARQFLAVKYVRLPDLLVEFSIARGNGRSANSWHSTRNTPCWSLTSGCCIR